MRTSHPVSPDDTLSQQSSGLEDVEPPPPPADPGLSSQAMTVLSPSVRGFLPQVFSAGMSRRSVREDTSAHTGRGVLNKLIGLTGCLCLTWQLGTACAAPGVPPGVPGLPGATPFTDVLFGTCGQSTDYESGNSICLDGLRQKGAALCGTHPVQQVAVTACVQLPPKRQQSSCLYKRAGFVLCERPLGEGGAVNPFQRSEARPE